MRDGALRDRGMAGFGEHLDLRESAAIRAYVVDQAWRGLRLEQATH